MIQIIDSNYSFIMIEIIASVGVIVSIVTMVFLVGIDPHPRTNTNHRMQLPTIHEGRVFGDDPPMDAYV